MSGLEKIKKQILDEARQMAETIIGETKKKAEELISEAEKDAQKEAEDILEDANMSVRNYAQRASSACEMQRRKALLSSKQELVRDVLEKAYRRVLSMPDGEYFKLIGRMLRKHVQPEKGMICFSIADLRRMPRGFESEIRKIASSKGGELTLERKGAKLDGGFILLYGKVEENCTIRAMFEAGQDRLSDCVQEVLF